MQQITPELTAFSELYVLSVGADLTDSQELDFNLARRTGVVICEIQGTLGEYPANADHVTYMVQEVDLDPDNVAVWDEGNPIAADKLELDSSRCFRQTLVAGMSATDGWSVIGDTTKVMSWRAEPLWRRPISITNIRHHLRQEGGAFLDRSLGKLQIQYVVVELSLEELGYINASRR